MNPAGGFAHHWQVSVLKQRPLILPRRRYVYPREAEEIERGALELLVAPAPGCARSQPRDKDASNTHEPFLATCALGFADPIAPTGVWSCPNPSELCAVAGGYAYMIDTRRPEHFEQIAYRPVLAVHASADPPLLLFVGNRSILAWGKHGQSWESPRLSDEGVTVTAIEAGRLHGTGWTMRTDRETAFALDLPTGLLLGR